MGGNDPFATTGNRTVGSSPPSSAKNSVFRIAAPFSALALLADIPGLSAAVAAGLCAETNFGFIEADCGPEVSLPDLW